MTFTVLPEADLEAAEAVIWYDDQRFGLGDDFLVELTQAFDRIRRGPQMLARLEYYTGQHEVRRCQLKRFPYLVIFVCRLGELLVVAISHARQRPLYAGWKGSVERWQSERNSSLSSVQKPTVGRFAGEAQGTASK